MEIKGIADLIRLVVAECHDTTAVMVEDENGEVRNVEFAWYDKERDMLRLTLRKTKFEDCEEV
jgi:hypothetical protein